VFSKQKMFDTTLGNLLGLQIFRIAVARASLTFRRMRCPERGNPYLRTLIREGYCAIEDFLPGEEFERVCSEFERSMSGEAKGISVEVDKFHISTKSVAFSLADKDKYPATIRSFLDNPACMAIFKGHEGRVGDGFYRRGSFRSWFQRAFTDLTRRPTEEESNSDLHTDTFHTLTKGFFYLKDVDVHNAAFTFVPRSHRLSRRRLLFEYWNSIGRKSQAPRVSDQELTRMGLKAQPMAFRANTLVIANTFGFHGRGMFSRADVTRDIVKLDYRSHPFR